MPNIKSYKVLATGDAMYITVEDILQNNYKGFNNKEIEGFVIKDKQTPLKGDNNEPIIDEEGNCCYVTTKVKEPVVMVDSTVFIKNEGTYTKDYIMDDGVETITYTKDAFLVNYLTSNNEESYYVAYSRPRLRGTTLISGELIDSYINNKQNGIDTPMCKSVLNGNINQSDEVFDSMDAFISAEKDINLTYIVDSVYEVYFDGCIDTESKDYSELDYNDWFVRVMRNEEGVYVVDGDVVMGYMLTDFMSNKDEIEWKVRHSDNRIKLY